VEKDNEEIISEIKRIKKLAEKEIVCVQVDVERIINEDLKNEEQIEHTLDRLLNLILLGFGDKEFHKLNNFYSISNPQNAESYKIFYEEMFEEKY